VRRNRRSRRRRCHREQGELKGDLPGRLNWGGGISPPVRRSPWRRRLITVPREAAVNRSPPSWLTRIAFGFGAPESGNSSFAVSNP